MANTDKTGQVTELVESILSIDYQYFVVKVVVRPINHISVFVDGDTGITIEKCVQVNRALYKKIVEQGICNDGEFSLEVSSPGVDEPLSMPRQYVKNIGRHVELETLDGRKLEGKLLAADESSIQLEEEKGKGKKKEIIQHFLLMKDIKSTIVKLIFK
jgi:ribosome maturation factor RimP